MSTADEIQKQREQMRAIVGAKVYHETARTKGACTKCAKKIRRGTEIIIISFVSGGYPDDETFCSEQCWKDFLDMVVNDLPPEEEA